LIDSFRGRVVVPVRDGLGRIEGFIGRDVTGDPRAAKYRNPTLTATFDKSRALYRPTRHMLATTASVVVVEGVMDVLAISAAAAEQGVLAEFAPCTTSGIAVSRIQAVKAVALTRNPVILALDGDGAGAQATRRWTGHIAETLGREVRLVRMPSGLDPAERLAADGPIGLTAFRRQHLERNGVGDAAGRQQPDSLTITDARTISMI
jgi:DNA primase